MDTSSSFLPGGRSISTPTVTHGTREAQELPSWAIGKIVSHRWRAFLGPRFYEVNARTEQGIIFGTTETGISTTLRRLAFNAARVGWRVFLFDAQGSDGSAATFLATMQQARPSLVPIASGGARPKSELPKSRLLHSSLDLPDILLDNLYDQKDAAYVSFNTWGSPREARHHAQFLLDKLFCSSLSCKTPVLLLINHPERLFDPEQMTPLFARMRASHGSLFLATSSPEDFGWAADRLMSDASVLLIHRSLSSRPFELYVARPWWKRNPLHNTALQRLSDHECFVLGKGEVSHVRVAPVSIDAQALMHATKSLMGTVGFEATVQRRKRVPILL